MIGQRIRFFRNKLGLTQKQLGIMMGFPEKSADIRVNQYEVSGRVPKWELLCAFSKIFGVSPHALAVPNISHTLGIMHTLFVLEDTHGFRISEVDGELCIKIDLESALKDRNAVNHDVVELYKMMCNWKSESMKREAGTLSDEEYDRWRYMFSEAGTYDSSAAGTNSHFIKMLRTHLGNEK